MAKPIVAIVGRPNVGKSTLFNRIAGGMVAIVEDKPGVTRDRLYRDAEWLDRKFTLVDTGGIEFNIENNTISSQMKKQAQLAMGEADVIVFVVDAKAGITPDDAAVAQTLRRASTPVIVAANKVENFQQAAGEIYEFYNLGLGEPIPVSAAHGRNIGDLLDAVISHFPKVDDEEADPDIIKIAVIGRPNVGKSSLVNSVLGQERVIVSNVPGTTRDAIDTPFEREGKNYILIDTAGMRRRGKIDEPTERYSVVRSLRAVDRSDVVLMLIEATEGVTEQDKKIAGYAHEAGKAIILIVNKWDLIEKDDKTMNKFDKDIREELAFMLYAPTLFLSAKTKQRVNKVLELVDFVAEQNAMRIATSTLNSQVREWVSLTPPPTDKGRKLKVLFATQAGVKPPTFVFFVNDPELMHFSYSRYLENQLRKNFGFEGSPIRMVVRQRDEEER